MDADGYDTGSVSLREPVDLHDLQDPNKGSIFEIDPNCVDQNDVTSNTYFKGEDVYKNLMPLDDDVAADVDNGLEPFEAMMKRMEDISEDGGVWKQVIRAGAGSLVPEGALVRIKYNAWKEYEDEPFDSSYLRNEVEKFRLGQDGSIRGMHVAVATMKTGEKSRFILKPEYFYGKMGCGERIPPNCTVLFEVELISFVEREGVDDYYSMTEEERRSVTFNFVRKVSKADKEEGNQQFKAAMYHKAVGKYRRAAKILEDYHLKNEEEEKEQRKLLIGIYLNMAVCHDKLRENGRTIHYCNEVLRMDEKSQAQQTKALYFKAKAKHSLGDFDEARNFFRQAQTHQPQNRDINEALQKLEQDVKRFQIQYKEMCKKMVSLGASSDDGEGAQKTEPSKTDTVRSEFKDVVWKQMKAFCDDPDLNELPFPDGSLTLEETHCIVEAAHEFGMAIQRRGTGNYTRMVVMKKAKH